MNIKELKRVAKKLQIPHSLYRLSGGASPEFYSIVRSKGKWEIYYSKNGCKEVIGVFDTESDACEAFYRLMKSYENSVSNNGNDPSNHKQNKIPKEWWITDTRISSRCNADVYFGERTVRIPGELLADCFLADPYAMFWLAEADRDVLPWELSPERPINALSDAERQSVMAAVNDYYLHRTHPIIFLTRELENRAFELAEMIRNKQFSGRMKVAERKAAAMLKNEFPQLPDEFYKAMLTASLAGVRWYKETENHDSLTGYDYAQIYYSRTGGK